MYLPAGHVVHAVDSVAVVYSPAGHTSHEGPEPGALEYLPTWQSEQALSSIWPEYAPYLLAGQSKQSS
jgi:hypothetical protein